MNNPYEISESLCINIKNRIVEETQKNDNFQFQGMSGASHQLQHLHKQHSEREGRMLTKAALTMPQVHAPLPRRSLPEVVVSLARND